MKSLGRKIAKAIACVSFKFDGPSTKCVNLSVVYVVYNMCVVWCVYVVYMCAVWCVYVRYGVYMCLVWCVVGCVYV